MKFNPLFILKPTAFGRHREFPFALRVGLTTVTAVPRVKQEAWWDMSGSQLEFFSGTLSVIVLNSATCFHFLIFVQNGIVIAGVVTRMQETSVCDVLSGISVTRDLFCSAVANLLQSDHIGWSRFLCPISRFPLLLNLYYKAQNHVLFVEENVKLCANRKKKHLLYVVLDYWRKL